MKLCSWLFLQTIVLLVAGDTCDVDTSGSGGDLIDLHIVGFFPCTNPEDKREIPVDNCDGIDRVPIMRLALEEINERCDLLPGYRLVVDHVNSGCASIPAMYHLIQQIDPSLPTKLMILGPACSVATELMGEVAQRYMNLTQVVYTASSSLFGKDKVRFPRFYRLVPVTEQMVDGYAALIEKLNWKRITVITDRNQFNLDAGIHTEKKLRQRVLARLTFTDDPTGVISAIEELRARIIITWIHPGVAVQLWCKVTKSRLAGPDFVWFIPGWFRANWWTAVEGTDCTVNEMKMSLEHTLGALGNSILDYDPYRVLVSKKNVAQFKQDLDKKNKLLGPVKTDIFLNFGYVYDTAWTIALALNASISTLEEKGLGRLEEYHSEWTEMSDVLTASVAIVEFEGISGKVSFYKDSGNRKDPSIRIVQYRDGVAVPTIIYVPTRQTKSLIELTGQRLKWKGGYIPKDAPSPVIQYRSSAETVIVVLATAFGFFSALCFLLFNISYRENLVVKRSSYRLNCVILSAILMGFIGTALYTCEPDNNYNQVVAALVCNLRHWMTELAFMISFATFFMKMWRLYKLFFNDNLSERKYLDDKHLLLAAAVITTPALVVLIIQASLFPITLHSYATINKNNLAEEEITFTCQGNYYLLFDTVLILIRAVLGIFSLIIAFETKKHLPTEKKYRKYYESAVINLSTIVAIIPSSICEVVVLAFQLSNIQNGLLLVICLRECLWMYAMSFLLFVPKVYRVYRGSLLSLRRFSIISNYSKPSMLGKRVIVEPLYVTTGVQYMTRPQVEFAAEDVSSPVQSTPQEDHHNNSQSVQGSQHEETTHQKCRRRVTFTNGPKDENIKDCVIIANTIQLEMMDDEVEPISVQPMSQDAWHDEDGLDTRD